MTFGGLEKEDEESSKDAQIRFLDLLYHNYVNRKTENRFRSLSLWTSLEWLAYNRL